MLNVLFELLWPIVVVTTLLAFGGLMFVFFATRKLD
jgi:hypothetical protein